MSQDHLRHKGVFRVNLYIVMDRIEVVLSRDKIIIKLENK